MKFEVIFNRILQEDMKSSSAFTQGNMAGSTAGSFANVDSYAPGDARIPNSLGTVEVRRDKRKKSKKKKKKNRSSKVPTVPAEQHPIIQSRQSGMTGPGNRSGFGFM